VIGPSAAIARYGDYEREANGKHISLYDGIHAELPCASVTLDDGSDIPAAVAKARAADVVILGLGEWQGVEGEGFDRANLDLPGNQEQLLEAVVGAGKPVVLVLENGRPPDDHLGEAACPGDPGSVVSRRVRGKAIAETLFGDNNPAGHLTVTFPKSVGQLPMHYNYDPSRTHKYVDDDGKPLFPFGWGLSYTTFTYSGLVVDTPAPGSQGPIQARVQVTNTGSRDGEDVVQLYLRQDYSSVETRARAQSIFTRSSKGR
jgi:beta-glucosidase